MEQVKQQEAKNTATEEITNQESDTATVAQTADTVTSGGIGYSGTIKVTIKRGKHTVSSKIYHNTGTPKLFEFMANILAGQYAMVSSKRPQRLMLFKRDLIAGTAKPCLSGPIMYNTTPYVQDLKTDGRTVGSAAVLHFVIPGTLFSLSTYDGAALYDATSTPDLATGSTTTDWPDANCCAYFTFNDALTVDEGETAIIDWQMNFQNL